MTTINQIEREFDHLSKIRSKVFEPVKLQLHTGLAGFNSPESFGIYRKNGGDALGIVGSKFEPANLHRYMDFITKSIVEDESGFFDLNSLDFEEFFGGSKVSFTINSKNFEVKSPVVGDVFQTKIHFVTGFDGRTKNHLTYSTLRLRCENGAKSWKTELDLSYKNTQGNVGKLELFTEELMTIKEDMVHYQEYLNQLAVKKVTQQQANAFMKKVFGYSQAEYNELATRTRHTLDRINEAVAIEEKELGMSAYALLQGVTRYTSHILTESIEDTLFGVTQNSAKMINERAHVAAIALLN